MIPAGAAGALTAEEWRTLDGHLSTCEGCGREYAAYLEAAALTALAVDPVTPPSSVRTRVMAEVDGAGAPNGIGHHSPSNVVPIAWRRAPAWWLAAAALVLAVGIAAWAISAIEQRQRNIEVLRQQLLASEREKIESSQREAELARKLDVLTSGETASIRMAGQEVAPAASASIFMNSPARKALVFFNHLPPTAPDKSYQLWVIRGDQPAPQSAGTFEVGADGKATLGVENLPVNTEIKAFALTLEPRGGGKAPTGPKFLVGS